jgi:glycosyltransferase involved in cell wall biosynthesis
VAARDSHALSAHALSAHALSANSVRSAAPAISNARASRPKVVAVVLAHNVAALLPKAVDRIPKDLVDAIIVMDDGSKDGTSDVARALGLPVYRAEENLGYGGNLRAGLERAVAEYDADYVVEIHGDGAQFNPAALALAVPFMERGVPFIMGSRFLEAGGARRNGMPWVRLLANRGLTFVSRAVLRLPLSEYHSGFRVYSRRFIETLPLTENASGHLFSFQILAQAAYFGLEVAEVPVEADYHSEHHSISLPSAAAYAVTSVACLSDYLLARSGLRHSPVFPKLAKSPTPPKRAA